MTEEQVKALLDALDALTAQVQRIAEALEREGEGAAYDRAMARWRLGEGQHPDD